MADPMDRDGGTPDETPVEIERPDPGDVDAVVDLWVALASDQRRYDSHIRPEPNRGVIRDTLARHAVTGELRTARHDGDVVGFVSFELERGAYESDETRGIVRNIYVDPGYRDRGIGGALLGAAETALADAGATVVALEAMAGNDSAQGFYRRRGYAPHRVQFEKPLDGEAATGPPDAEENDTHSKED
ncbi:GNAT family N-acetyltransferase [Halobellus salinus]|uniref:GNAT family N-acetyltransferase n=1 Tax=Halobellus salinus TaxID=931585 RepID=A0A830EEL5_9EURY|nr:GNAT family N-acetyltransferase [Halobellus salinus]GGJ02621.1 GNAT family N-acetyltransferase [Halobellus salinus]SMP16817.1 Acetyltransferase, GNAT family [Halobellus salinus]